MSELEIPKRLDIYDIASSSNEPILTSLLWGWKEHLDYQIATLEKLSEFAVPSGEEKPFHAMVFSLSKLSEDLNEIIQLVFDELQRDGKKGKLQAVKIGCEVINIPPVARGPGFFFCNTRGYDAKTVYVSIHYKTIHSDTNST